MEEWQPEDPQLLQFDFNNCTERELCEVFDLEPGLARRLFQYRTEIMHVFDLQDMLKVEGVSPRLIQQWGSPPPPDPAGFNAELRQSLGAQADGSAPLPKLMETVCLATGATACLLTARNGKILIQNGDGSPLLQTLAPKLPELIDLIDGDLLGMNLGTARCQAVSFEQNDVVVLPSGGFYLVAVQPPQSLDPSKISLWRAVAAEISRRFPPRFYIENHAQATTADIAFDCPKCVLRILVDSSAAGYAFPCPRCQTEVTVPSQSTSNGSYYDANPGESASVEGAAAS